MATSDNTYLYLGGAGAILAAWFFRQKIADSLGVTLPASLAPAVDTTIYPDSSPGSQSVPDPVQAAQTAASLAASNGATPAQQAVAAQVASTVTAPPQTPVQIAAAAAAQLAAQLQTQQYQAAQIAAAAAGQQALAAQLQAQQYQAALLAATMAPKPTPIPNSAAPPHPGTVLAPGVVINAAGTGIDAAGAVQDAQLYNYLVSQAPTYSTDAYGNLHQNP